MQTPGGLPNPPSPGRPSPWMQTRLWTDKHLWKHYLAPNFVFGRYLQYSIFVPNFFFSVAHGVQFGIGINFLWCSWKMKLVNATERQRSATLSGRIPSSVHDCLLNITSCGKWVKDAVGLTYKPQRSTFQLTQYWYLWDLFNMLLFYHLRILAR